MSASLFFFVCLFFKLSLPVLYRIEGKRCRGDEGGYDFYREAGRKLMDINELGSCALTNPLFLSHHSWDGREGAHSSESNSMTQREHLGGLL